MKLVAEKRRQRGDDLLSHLATKEVEGDRLSDDELISLATLLFIAGFETTTHLFGNGLLALLRQPEQIDLLRRDPSLFANLPDELMRYDTPLQLVSRVTETSVEVGGMTIPAGETVLILLGAGNRDPARYSNPDRLDVTRTEIRPLSLGGGVHYCLGAALARAEIGIAFRTLLQRFDHIELAGDQPCFHNRTMIRGLTALNISCRVASTRRSSVAAAAASVAIQSPATTASTEHTDRGLRPQTGDTDADLRWRAELRQRIETEPSRHDSLPVHTGARLAATVALLRRNSLFDRCTKEELEQLAVTAYPMSFDAGDLLCAEGGESPECYIIEEGQAVVTIGRKVIRTVGEDDVVGERGVLLDTVRSATVTAVTQMITYAISRERLRALVVGNPAARQWMLKETHRRYRRG